MLKKYGSVLMMLTALAIMLGHNLIPHHHHDFEQTAADHHHSDHHHYGAEENENGENKESKLGHLFAHFQHSENGFDFLSNHHFTHSLSKQIFPPAAVLAEVFVYKTNIDSVRQNSPPYKEVYLNLQCLLPTGSRAPPTFIV